LATCVSADNDALQAGLQSLLKTNIRGAATTEGHDHSEEKDISLVLRGFLDEMELDTDGDENISVKESKELSVGGKESTSANDSTEHSAEYVQECGVFKCWDLCDMGCEECYCGPFEIRWRTCGCDNPTDGDKKHADKTLQAETEDEMSSDGTLYPSETMYPSDYAKNLHGVEAALTKRLIAKERASKKKADAEEIAPTKKADSEEIVSTKNSDSEEIASTKKADSEEIASTKKADSEEIAPTKKADSEEIVPIKKADAEEIAPTKRSNTHDDVRKGLQMYFDSLQVVLGYAPPPEDEVELNEVMSPFVKEVQWALGAMHPGFDKDSVNDDAVMKQLSHVAGMKRKTKSTSHNNRRRNLQDSDMCLEKTRDILSISMRLAYYGMYGDLHNNDEMIQNSGNGVAGELDVEEARERLRQLGPLQHGEDEYRLIAKDVFKFAENELGLDGIVNEGMKNWDVNNYWAAGFFASEMWASALQIDMFDTFPISKQTFLNPDTSLQDTISEEFNSLVEDYNTHCATCPMGWTDNGIKKNKGLHCTTGFTPSCDEHCLEEKCRAAKGKWENVDVEFNPYTCYMSVCPSGWKNLGYKDGGKMMCTAHRANACDESCAEVQCTEVGGTFPLAIDDIADNPYVCFV